jgi:hypothetical protein
MNEIVFYTAFLGLHGAAIAVAVFVALRALDHRSGKHITIGP